MYAIRFIKKKEKELVSQRMAEDLLTNNTRDLFREVKKMNPKPAARSHINGLKNDSEIADHFAQKYQDLYNSIPSDTCKIDIMMKETASKITSASLPKVQVTLEHIQDAVKSLKHNKRDGKDNLFSDHLIYSSHEFQM